MYETPHPSVAVEETVAFHPPPGALVDVGYALEVEFDPDPAEQVPFGRFNKVNSSIVLPSPPMINENVIAVSFMNLTLLNP